MATATLMAFPELIFIDRKAGQKNGTTSIFYTGDTSGYGTPILWERIVGKPWTRIDPLTPPRILSSPSGNPKRDGTFSKTLKAGQMYQVAMYHYEYIDPNVTDPNVADQEEKPDALVTVIAMLKDPEPTKLITSQDKSVGGTWFRKVVTTSVPTFSVLQVSKDKPFQDGQGLELFLAPLETLYDTPKLHHDQQVEPLLAGNDFFYLVRLVDEAGNWQVVSDQFRTKQRTVTIDFDVLHIINDGANGDTTAEFHIWVMEGNTTVRDYFFGDVDNFDISDSPDPGDEDQEFIPLASPRCPTFVLGPKDISEETNDVGILTRGLVFRTFGSNDYAMNFFGDPDPVLKNVPSKAKFRFPTGDGENIQNVPFFVRAVPQVADAEIEYDVKAILSVQYT